MSLIDSVRGKILERDAESVVVAAGGFGIRVLAPAGTINRLPEPGAEVTLHTHLHVREDALVLYGFSTREERSLFLQLLTVSGVGPKVALGALSSGPVERLAGAIAAGDVDTIARTPGIGRKTAQRIVLDLKGKLELPAGAGAAAPGAPGDVFEVAAAALRELGFTPSEVSAALASLPRDQALTEEDAVRLAFKYMGSRR